MLVKTNNRLLFDDYDIALDKAVRIPKIIELMNTRAD
jgi:hypothetical protein